MGIIKGLLGTTLMSTLSFLDQTVTNGASLLGTLGAPKLPKYLSSESNGDVPWGQCTTRNTNPYGNSPNTGVVRKYQFTVARETLAPDGFERPMIVVNGQYPGPTIEANWGDIIEVTVNNEIHGPEEGTAIHLHGFLQHETPWMDGAPGFSQCPIAPGKSFTYRTKAELFGTSWWHAHFSAQYADGVFGAIVVYGPWEKEHDIDLGPVIINEFHHTNYVSIVQNITAPHPRPPPPSPISDSNLINGKMQFDCARASRHRKCSTNAGVSQFRFQSGKKHRLRLINAGADSSQQFSIDGHTMTVIQNDYVAVQPYDTKIVTLGVGQRTDVIVTANGKPTSSYWMRSNITCFEAHQPQALGMIYYESVDTDLAPTSSPWPNSGPGCANDALEKTVPAYPMAVPQPEKTIALDMTTTPDARGIWRWYVNNSTFYGNHSSPVLNLAASGAAASAYQPTWNVYDMETARSYRFISYNRTPGPHPLHLHGHNMYVLAIGVGSAWDGKIVRPENPVRRDVVMVPANGYVVWQADADNPGAWAFHCHVLWHAATGFGIDIVEGKDALREMKMPPEMDGLCRDWKAYVGRAGEEQIDSGL
ncbi:uncharacterized protein HMPREF1541_00468 [Cyphellophora europaea CBS 101466]|uniref:L-ascorbate oxidase n=1 Tax=Cyphellophora europaea (strain CBS 101466) TaxID=1220924 RepID=W2SEE5_CYPE1|nr:uncharacterized protein HMPREF1541_00468 [Cyphellophora europaea CBS 101466]ETN46284.1 hypothetical protein HMPREF1541_00468 [Cyphellophora europaea CBS 101466]